MTKNLYIIVAFLVISFLGACAATDSPDYDNSLAPVNASKVITPMTIADTLLSEDKSSTSPTTPAQTVVSAPVIKTQPSAIANKSSNNTALNPAHGQPNHRCDIAVGAPLNSPPGNVTAPVTQTVMQPQPQPANTSGSGTAGLNPAHGQPGHDCAIAVGAPLKN